MVTAIWFAYGDSNLICLWWQQFNLPMATAIWFADGDSNIICLYDGHGEVTPSSMFLDPHTHSQIYVPVYDCVEGLIFMR